MARQSHRSPRSTSQSPTLPADPPPRAAAMAPAASGRLDYGRLGTESQAAMGAESSDRARASRRPRRFMGDRRGRGRDRDAAAIDWAIWDKEEVGLTKKIARMDG
jgi:hypothetical protein